MQSPLMHPQQQGSSTRLLQPDSPALSSPASSGNDGFSRSPSPVSCSYHQFRCYSADAKYLVSLVFRKGIPSIIRYSKGPLFNPIPSQFALAPNPADWGPIALSMKDEEPDDYLHNPDPTRDMKADKGGNILTSRGLANLGCLFILVVGIMMLL